MRIRRSLCMVLTVLLATTMLPVLLSVGTSAAPAASRSNGSFIVKLWDGSAYKQVATISTDEFQKELQVDIGKLTNPQLRIRKEAEGLGFLDSVSLDGIAASNAKLLKTDFDVQEVTTEGIVLNFTGSYNGNLILTGRIEPKVIIGEPFMFPFGNTYIKDPQNLKTFFTYELGSNPRTVQVDGQNEDLGRAFDNRYLVPATGHPNGYAYIYVSNDDEYLYACADFTSDNTFDNGADFFKVFANVDGTVKEFKQTSNGREYGLASMQYTDKVPYEHMYYELKIPLDALGSTDKLQLAFSLYGTAAISTITSDPASLSFTAGHSASGILRIANFFSGSTLNGITYTNDPELTIQFHIPPLPEPDSEHNLDIPYTVECAVPESYSIYVAGITIDGYYYPAFPELNIPVEVSAAAPVSITKQPGDIAVTAGENATFTVEASGTTPYTYQWEKSEDDGVSFAPITGATTDTLTLSAVTLADNGTQYRCVVNNIAGSPATSSAATLTVTAPPVAVAVTITTQPENKTVTAGRSATFTVGASGTTPYTYQWEKSEDGGDSFAPITDATTDTLTLNAVTLADSGTQYRCVVNNIAGSPATSSAATLTVTAPPVAIAVTITKPPEDMTVTAGEDATFTVKANGTKPYTYQWEKSEDGGDSFMAITGATTDTLTLDAVTLADSGTQYRCVVNNRLDSPATSAAATLTVTATPITGLPNTYTMGLGSSVTWDPQPSGGTWDWDEEFFSATFNSTATFTALRTGTSTISYTVHRTSHFISVTVSSSLPSTGPEQNFLWLYTLIGAATCIIAAAILAYVKRMARE